MLAALEQGKPRQSVMPFLNRYHYGVCSYWLRIWFLYCLYSTVYDINIEGNPVFGLFIPF